MATSEMKLLLALCDALGLEVEEVEVSDRREFERALDAYDYSVRCGRDEGNKPPNSCDYTTIDYKITKKKTKYV